MDACVKSCELHRSPNRFAITAEWREHERENSKVQKMNFLTSLVLVGLLLSAPAVTWGQSYDKLSKAIAKLDSTLKVIVEKQKAKQPAPQQIADVEGAASATPRPAGDVSGVYELASDLEGVVAQLQGVVTEAKEAEKSRPQNVTSSGYGRISFKGLFQQQYYTREGTQRTSSFETKAAQFGVTGEINSGRKLGFWADFCQVAAFLMDAFIALSPNKYWSSRWDNTSLHSERRTAIVISARPSLTRSKDNHSAPYVTWVLMSH